MVKIITVLNTRKPAKIFAVRYSNNIFIEDIYLNLAINAQDSMAVTGKNKVN